MVKNLLAMWETRIQSLGWKDPLEKERREEKKGGILGRKRSTHKAPEVGSNAVLRTLSGSGWF